MIYNSKEHFGYAYIWTVNKKMQGLLFAYCEGRSAIWRMFFGWRKTCKNGQMFFWIPSHKIGELLEIAKNF